MLADRLINDGMIRWVLEQLVLEMSHRGLEIAGDRMLVLGVTFKDGCSDLHNTQTLDIIKALRCCVIEFVLRY